MSRLIEFKGTSIPDLWTAERKGFEDNRGVFLRMFCADEFQEIGFNKPIVQINRSVTRMKGTVRGLHLQCTPHAETKIISCSTGEVFDVAVDLRRNSKTFLSWHGEILSAENKKSIIIPEGFAHGYQALTENCEMLYFHTEFYTPESELGFNVNDKRIDIDWPLPTNDLSERDQGLPFVDDDYTGEHV